MTDTVKQKKIIASEVGKERPEKAPRLMPPAAPQDWTSFGKKSLRRLSQSLLVFVLLPSLIVACYYIFIAADQYRTEMHLAIRSAQGGGSMSMLGNFMAGASNMSQSAQDAKSIAEYIHSHDAVRELDEAIDLRGIFAHPDADFFTKMDKDASFEGLFKAYHDKVDVAFNPDTNTAIVYVQAYTAKDARLVADNLWLLSEQKINSLNARAEEDALRLARQELKAVEDRITQARQRLVDFRLENGDIDPSSKSTSIMGIISGLETEKSQSQAELQRLSSYMKPGSVQIKVLEKRIAALDQQVSKEQERLTGSGNTYAQKLSDYEALIVEQELSQLAYTSALASLENARLEVQRQKSYVVPIIKPHEPETAEYPKRVKNTLLFFVQFLLLFGIGRLILAGIKDHVMQ